ncbi:heavy metal translocating P-type ATPase [Streptoverticillium reticulum]|uniref:heavy metal translocating P-type ATPase n=1 Tax=Streptoverticillium reticulum TaxID=1433415 RepID=UPI0039BFA839
MTSKYQSSGIASARPAAPRESGSHDHADGFFGRAGELVFAGLAAATFFAGLLLNLVAKEPDMAFGFFVATYFFGGFFTVREAITTIRDGRFEVDFLMLVAAAGAAAVGKWEEGAVLLFLFSVGHALESYAMGRARRSIEALAELAPSTALLLRDGERCEVPVESLVFGDVVVVKPHARIPADGFVLTGTSSIDQASVTGESIPADKRPVADREVALRAPVAVPADSRVFAGTVNGSGMLEIVTTGAAKDSTLARVVELVRDAESQQSPTQVFTARFQRVFVPFVLALVTVLLLAGPLLNEPFSATFYRAMAVLVAASPCALAIATPAAVLSAVARAARSGVLVKGGGPLERLGRLTSFAFDKTGTLTEGRPRLTDVYPSPTVSEGELLAVATAVERLSDHPVASAVVRDAADRLADADVPQAEALKAVVGRGVMARVGDDTVWIGSSAFFDGLPGAQPPHSLIAQVKKLEQGGRTVMIVRQGERYLGALGVMDTPRADAALVVAQLRALGIRRAVMLSGDNQAVVTAVARQINLDDARGGLLPEDKVAAVAQLDAGAGKVAMVGDGVNDAPAMANATVGVAMGAAGSAVALETADIALMSDDLGRLPMATGLSRKASRIIKQNLYFSLGIVALLVPATLLGLGIGPAVLIHESSTLVVVANALRLLGYRHQR